jgi:hypothetical protein
MADFPIMMSAAEVEFLKAQLGKAQRVVEFGAGGSTVLAASYPNIQHVTTIESDPAWIEKVTKGLRAPEKVTLVHGDIGPVKAFGHPKDFLRQADKFRNYWEPLAAVDPRPDFILIDGRFRVACLLFSLLCAPEALYAIHDYTNRPAYHVVEEFAQKGEYVGTLQLFKRREGVSDDAIRLKLQKYCCEAD